MGVVSGNCGSSHFCLYFVAGDNLFIGCEGQLKIGDFGHAQYMEDGVVHSDMEGTVHYMAPEVSTLFFVFKQHCQ